MLLKEMLELRDALKAKIKGALELGDKLTDEGATQLENDLAEARKLDGDIEKRQTQGKVIEDAADWLKPREQRSAGDPPRAPDLELNKRNRRDPVENPDGAKYSLCRAMLAIVDGRKIDGYEAEVSQEIRHRFPQPSGVYNREAPVTVPWTLTVDVRTAQNAASRYGLPEKRALNLSAAAGGIWPQQETSMIDLLRAKNGITRMGCLFFSGVTGNKIIIPKQTAGMTAYWLAEAGAPTTSQLTTGTVEVVPKTCGAFTDLTRSVLVQQSMDFEMYARNELITTLAIAIDSAGYNGTGADNQPLGILNDSSIATVALGTDGAAFSYGKLVEMEATVDDENYDSNSFYYVGNSKVKAKLKTTLVGSNTAAIYLLRDGEVNDTPFFKSNLIPKNLEKGEGENLSATIYGDFAQYIIALWSGLDLILDPYALATSGGKRIIGLQDVGMKPRQPKAFSKVVDAVTTLA